MKVTQNPSEPPVAKAPDFLTAKIEKISSDSAIGELVGDYIWSIDGRGYFNQQGEVAIKPIFDRYGFFSEGLASICLYDDWGYINEAGEVIIKPYFSFAGPFHNGQALKYSGST